MVTHLIRFEGTENAYSILSSGNYPTKHSWLFGYYIALPSDDVTMNRLANLNSLYQDASPSELPHNFDLLLKFRDIDSQIIRKVTNGIIDRVEIDPNYALVLCGLFNSYTQAGKELFDLFAMDFGLLKRAYLLALKANPSIDHDGTIFSQLLDFDSGFALEYFDQICEQTDQLLWMDNERDYSFLWMHQKYSEMMPDVIEHVFIRCQTLSRGDYLENILLQRAENKDNTEISKRQDYVLMSLIERNCGNIKFLQFLFDAICSRCAPDRRTAFISCFLKNNRNYNDFEQVPIEPHAWSSNGSWVPVLQKRIEYMESILLLLNTVDLLHHRQYVEQQIEGLRLRMESEKKKDFMRD
jgi:hypothetical protein